MGKIIIKYSFLLKLPSQIIVILFSLEILIIAKLLWSSQHSSSEKKCRRTKKGYSYFLYCYYFPILFRIRSLWKKRESKKQTNKKSLPLVCLIFYSPKLLSLPPPSHSSTYSFFSKIQVQRDLDLYQQRLHSVLCYSCYCG